MRTIHHLRRLHPVPRWCVAFTFIGPAVAAMYLLLGSPLLALGFALQDLVDAAAGCALGTAILGATILASIGRN